MSKEISFEALREVADSKDVQVLDCRASEYFNGWPMAGEEVGGHIPGAVHFDQTWLELLEDAEVIDLLTRKGLDTQSPVFVLESTQTKPLYEFLLGHGYTSIQLAGTLGSWPGELSSLASFKKLVSARWLDERVREGPVQNYMVVEVGCGPCTESVHIPSAVYLDVGQLESKPFWNRVANKEIVAYLTSRGMQVHTPVILYGRDTTAAARAAVLMMQVGMGDVCLLDGGLQKWLADTLPTHGSLVMPEPVANFGDYKEDSNPLTDIEEARSILADPAASLASIRSWREYVGKSSGYDYIDAKGRIPGDKWGHSGTQASPMADYRNPDNTMRSADEICRFWSDYGITRNRRVTFYCGTGWRASEAFFYAWLMGWKRISVFDGGWFEWSSDPLNPIATGIPI